MGQKRILLIVLVVMFLLYVVALLCIFLDLRAGVRRAKANGVYRASKKYRNTVIKISQYFGMMFIFSIIDIIQMALIFLLGLQTSYQLPYIPLFTAIATCIIASIERKSMKEKQSQKDQARLDEATKEILSAITNPNNREAVITILEQFTKKNNDLN